MDSETSVLDQSVIEYGGHTHQANMYMNQVSPVVVRNSTIQHSSGHGIFLYGAAVAQVEHNRIAQNNGHGIYGNSALGAASLVENELFDNGDTPINLHPNSVQYVGNNVGSGNGSNYAGDGKSYDYIQIRGAELTVNATWSALAAEALPYVVTGDVTVRHSSANGPVAVLTIETGGVVKFEPGTGLFIGRNYYGAFWGALVAQGTPDVPITFTSNAASPQPGDWKGIYFQNTTDSTSSFYTVELQLEDNLGNRDQARQYQFTVDTTPPPASGIDPMISPTNNPNQTITGTKEAYAAILLDGEQIVGHTSSTAWQYSVTLNSANEGQNVFTFTARDQARNQSDSAVAEIIFDDIAPLPVTTLAVDEEGNGTSAALNWSGYAETEHGDIASYRIYVESAPFNDVSALVANTSVSAGTFSAAVNDLTRNTTYWFAVVAEDNSGKFDPAVTSVEAQISDIVPPENVTNLQVVCAEATLTFTWDHSANSAGDLAG